MSCSTCGSSTNCTTGCPECANTLTGDCAGPCATDCGCGSTDFPCPQPYYAEGFPSAQDHGGKPCCPTYFTTVKVSVAWNIPACGLTAVIIVPYLKSIIVGSNIWNPGYGYFEVTLFNPDTYEVTVKNNCLDGNAAVGTQVPKCAEFMVVSPCCETGGGGSPTLFPYLAGDFVAPAVSGCLDIIVTTVNGLQVGKNIQIGSGTYRISGIAGSAIVGICNDGAGITPGTPVFARNGAGDLQYPIILIDSNPCNASLVTSAVLLGCSGGILQPVTGLTVGSVFVLTDPVTGLGQFQVTGQPTFTCTALVESLTLTIGQPTYTLTVADSSIFSPTDVVQLGSRTDRFTVTSVPDATHVVGTFSPVPGSVQLIPIGTSVCLIGCCETLQGEVDVLTTNLATTNTALAAEITLRNFNQAQLAVHQHSASAGNQTGTLSQPTGLLVSNTVAATVVNGAALAHNMVIAVNFDVQLTFSIAGGNTDVMTFDILLQLDIDGGGFLSYAFWREDLFVGSDSAVTLERFISKTLTFAIAGGSTSVYTVKARMNSLNGGGAVMTVTTFQPNIHTVGVSV